MSANRLTTPNPITARHGDQLAPANAERSLATSADFSCTGVLLPMLSLAPVFAHSQREDHGIENGEGDQAGGRVQRDPVRLVADEETQESDHPGIGPQLVEEQGDGQHDLHSAVGQQINGAEAHCTAGEGIRAVQKVRGDQIVRVLRQFSLGQEYGDVPNSIGTLQEEQDAAEQLSDPIDALADDADLKDPVKPIVRSEHTDLRPGVLLSGWAAERRVNVLGVGLEPLFADLQSSRGVGGGGNAEEIATAELAVPAPKPIQALVFFLEFSEGVLADPFLMVKFGNVLVAVCFELRPLLLPGIDVQLLQPASVLV